MLTGYLTTWHHLCGWLLLSGNLMYRLPRTTSTPLQRGFEGLRAGLMNPLSQQVHLGYSEAPVVGDCLAGVAG